MITNIDKEGELVGINTSDGTALLLKNGKTALYNIKELSLKLKLIMCWITFKVINAKPKIAKEDVPILKIVERRKNSFGKDEYLPYFMKSTVYDLNKLTPEKSINVYDNRRLPYSVSCEVGTYEIREGYHSYAKNSKVNIWNYGITVMDRHYSKSSEPSMELCLMEGVIPKGTSYFINEFNEIVSEQIILKDVLAII